MTGMKRQSTAYQAKSEQDLDSVKQRRPSSSHPQDPSRGLRTSNACQQCKRRKTKCSGRPTPCEACEKAAYVCVFDDKAESRSKLKTTSSSEDDRVQNLLNGVLNAMKHNDAPVLGELLRALREDGSSQEVATHLRQNLAMLQDRGIIANLNIADNDLITLADRVISGSIVTPRTDSGMPSKDNSTVNGDIDLLGADFMASPSVGGSLVHSEARRESSSALSKASGSYTPNFTTSGTQLSSVGFVPSQSPAVFPEFSAAGSTNSFPSIPQHSQNPSPTAGWDTYPTNEPYQNNVSYPQTQPNYAPPQFSSALGTQQSDPSLTMSPWLQIAGQSIYQQDPNMRNMYTQQQPGTLASGNLLQSQRPAMGQSYHSQHQLQSQQQQQPPPSPPPPPPAPPAPPAGRLDPSRDQFHCQDPRS